MSTTLIGLASTFKLTPPAVFPYSALRRPRAAVALVVTVGALAFGWVAVIGTDPWRAFLSRAPANIAFWEDRLENGVSVTGLVTRLVSAGRRAEPLVDVPMTARLISGRIGAALVLIWRLPARTSQALEGALFALWSILGALLNPFAWLHTSILTLLPAALILRAATDPPVPLRNEVRTGCRVAVVLARLSLPKETLQALAGAAPVPPGRVTVLALPCYGTLARFGAAVLVARNGAPDRAGARQA